MDTFTIQIIGVAIGAYSAGLATYKPIYDWYSSKKRVLEVVAKIPDYADQIVDFLEIVDTEDGGGVYYFKLIDALEANVKLIITNVSKRTIVLHSYGISTYSIDNDEYCDCKIWDTNEVLKSKDSKTIFIPISEILNNLKIAETTDTDNKYKLFATDEKNKKYTCDFDFDYNYWYKLGETYKTLNDYYEKSPEKFNDGLRSIIHMMADSITKWGDLRELDTKEDGPKS